MKNVGIDLMGESKVASVYDVAAYILQQMAIKEPSGITAWKLQKLVYYSQAWSLVWDDQPLFDEPIEAWANGPVCSALYDQHRGLFKVSCLKTGNADGLAKGQKETIDKVVEHYGKKTSQYLSELTHSEAPWIEARNGLNPGDRGNNRIEQDTMALYYGGLYDTSSEEAYAHETDAT